MGRFVDPPVEGRGRSSHLHFCGISRREFMGASALAASSLLLPSFALADDDELMTVLPRPIPGGITIPFADGKRVFVHHFSIATPPALNEPSQITDFDGFVANCRVRGSATEIDARTGASRLLNFQVDNGFMDGAYIGVDGGKHSGTFGFV